MSNEKCREKILTNIAICDIIIKVCVIMYRKIKFLRKLLLF